MWGEALLWSGLAAELCNLDEERTVVCRAISKRNLTFLRYSLFRRQDRRGSGHQVVCGESQELFCVQTPD